MARNVCINIHELIENDKISLIISYCFPRNWTIDENINIYDQFAIDSTKGVSITNIDELVG